MPTEPEYLNTHYASYGSNLNIKQMLELCPDALLLSLDRLYGYRLACCGKSDGQARLTLKKAEGYSVPIALWKITQKDKDALDLHEQVPNLYECLRFILHKHPCYMYIMNPSYPECRASKEYQERVLQGYQDMGFDPVDLQCAGIRPQSESGS